MSKTSSSDLVGVASATLTSSELADLAPRTRWDIEEKLPDVHSIVAAFNDEELRGWVEDGKTQAWIAKQVGRDRSRVSRRCKKLGIQPKSNRRLRKRAGAHTSKGRRLKPDEPTIQGRPSISHRPDVVEWVRKLTRRGWTVDEIVSASKEGANGWPGNGKVLSNGGMSEIRAVIAHNEARERRQIEKIKTPDARLRQIQKAKPQASAEFFHLYHALSTAIYQLAEIRPAELDEEDDLTLDTRLMLDDELGLLMEWAELRMIENTAVLGDMPLVKRIEALRAKTVENNATPAEAEAAANLADKLERKLEARLGVGSSTE